MPRIPLRQDEQIVAEIRRFGFTYVWKWVLALIPLAIAGIYMFRLFHQGTRGIIGFYALITVGIVACISNYLRFQGNVLLITNYRLVDIAKDGIFGRTISEAELGDVEDIVVRQRGVWRMLCNYGTIEIRIRNAKIRIDVEFVHRPTGVQRLINELKKQYGKGAGTILSPTLFEEMHKQINQLSRDELVQLQKLVEAKLKQLRG